MGEVHRFVIDKELSRRVARALGVGKELSYRSLLKAFEWLPELAGGCYVEGWAVALNDSSVFAHGWIELNGRVVDPLLYQTLLTYFGGVRFDPASVTCAAPELSGLAEASDDGAFLQCLAPGEGNQVAMESSCRAAQAYAETLAQKMSWMHSVAAREQELVDI
jgi:hypothetical protein